MATGRWTRLRKEIGPSDVRFHEIRHFVATELLTANINLRTVANRLGYARTSTTLDIGARPAPVRCCSDQAGQEQPGRVLLLRHIFAGRHRWKRFGKDQAKKARIRRSTRSFIRHARGRDGRVDDF
ncbi:MAG: tyrosine-type recombinase/integrase [Acidimicrobiales bacterium]|jgi:hypothetical protein